MRKALRTLDIIVLIAALGLVAGAVIWWAMFYEPLVRNTPYTLSDALPCLYSTPLVCSGIIKVTQFLGKQPYTPEVFWVGSSLLFLRMLLR